MNTHGKIANIYIVYEIVGSSGDDNSLTLQNAIFSTIELTTNVDIDKYGYSGYGIGFDRRSSFSHPSGGDGQNVIIFGVHMSSSTKIDIRKKNILILGKGSTQELEHTLTAEKMYSINFSRWYTKVCLSLHYNGSNSYFFVNGNEIHKFKAKDSEIVATSVCLWTISKGWTVDNMKKLDFTAMFMILVLIMMLLQLMIY